jgi:hypothetical protein
MLAGFNLSPNLPESFRIDCVLLHLGKKLPTSLLLPSMVERAIATPWRRHPFPFSPL